MRSCEKFLSELSRELRSGRGRFRRSRHGTQAVVGQHWLVMRDGDDRCHGRLLNAHGVGSAGRHRLTLTWRPWERAVGVRVRRAVSTVARHRHAWHRHAGHVHVRGMTGVIVAAKGATRQWHGHDSALQHDGGETAKGAHAGMLMVLRAIEQSGPSLRAVRVSAVAGTQVGRVCEIAVFADRHQGCLGDSRFCRFGNPLSP